jgi:hypothetical protein
MIMVDSAGLDDFYRAILATMPPFNIQLNDLLSGGCQLDLKVSLSKEDQSCAKSR